MVKVKYFKDATKSEHEYNEFINLGEFLRSTGLSVNEMRELKFFNGDILGAEIDTENGEFIFIDSGEVTVINSSTIPSGPVGWLYVAVFVVAAYVAVKLSKVDNSVATDVDSVSQGSSTNSLSDSSNELTSVGDRVDDIFGRVVKHVPKYWQLPYRIGVNDQETEIQYLCVGRGKYEIDKYEIYDNTTKFLNIPGATVDIYEPGTWPGNGLPVDSTGNVIDRPLGIVSEHASLSATELVPSNDLTLGGETTWTVSGDGSNGTFTLTNYDDLDVDLTEYFTSGANLSVLNTEVVQPTSSLTVYRLSYEPWNNEYVPEYSTLNGSTSKVDISGDYLITSVTTNSITVSGFGFSLIESTIDDEITELRDEETDTLMLYTTGDYANLSKADYEDTYLYSEDTPNGVPAVSGAPTTGGLGLDSNRLIGTLHSSDADIGGVFDNTVGPFVLEEGTTKAICNLTSSSGFYKIVGSDYTDITASVKFVVQEIDEDDNYIGNQTETVVTYDSNSSSNELSVYRTFEIDVPYDRARIYATRTSDRDLSSNVTNSDKIEWTLLYTYQPLPDDTDLGDVTTMHCLIPSNSQSRLVASRNTNLTVTRLITPYLGNGLLGEPESVATSSFEQILIHTALDPKIGRLSLNDINADNLLLLRDEIIAYSGDERMTEFGYVFDSTQLSYDDYFTQICDVVCCIPYVRDGKYDAYFEGEQTESSFQITHRNKKVGSETRTDDFSRTYDSVELTYRDNDEDGTNVTIYVPEDRSGVSPETITLSGCVNEIQATQYAYRMYYRQKYERTTIEFQTDEFGRMITPGQRIDSPDSTRFSEWSDPDNGYKVYDGEIVEVNGLTIELSQPVTFTAGENHYIQFTNLQGDNSELIQCYADSFDGFVITLDSLPSESLYDGYSRDRTKFTFCSEQMRESIAMIPKSIELSVDEKGEETITITSKNYDARVYQNDVRDITEG